MEKSERGHNKQLGAGRGNPHLGGARRDLT